MENVFFYPRVGKDYNKGFNGVNLLILGESHYCGEGCPNCGNPLNNNCFDFTINALDRYIDYKKGKGEHEYWMNTFTRFTNILLEEQVDNKILINFWDSVIFYNYVQSSTEGPRISPTSIQFEESKNAFIEVIDEYEPDLILVWGERLWNKMPSIGRWGSENILDKTNGRFYYYKGKNKEIPAYCIYHPSSQCFDYNSSKYLKEAIRLASTPVITNDKEHIREHK